ncbi:MAG: tRNA (N(6)-L-threonylcarbamoyladenosine(37)-C(2))-methylthiotransferase MtaB [Alphaproteobacteria bacterium]|nr:tRNA (N(6)-L-threonylcarbamoyladenosine(37)-C(2))-methylthiotransferase MtaB [Alphaproteobacteria bacterium]
MSVKIITFGCRLNSCESDVIRQKTEEAGLKDAIILNTCAVTAEATRQARQAIRRARREHPSTCLIVTGCAAQIEAENFAKMSEVDFVIGNEEKFRTGTYRHVQTDFLLEDTEKIIVNDIMSIKETAGHMAVPSERRARAFLQVQNGCNHRCTFCTIPYGRGNARSVPMGVVVENAKKLVAESYTELVITGVDLTSYGQDLPGNPSLGRLVLSILHHVPKLKRLRISSIDSIEIDEDFLKAFAEEERLMPHLHLSLQAGDDLILKRMKRRHSRADTINFCQKVRRLRPDTAFGADIIAGFPTETEAMFANSMRIVDECELAFLHVFPFSPRPGTPAARMPQVSQNLIKERSARLREKGRQAMIHHLDKLHGSMHDVLIETENKGRTPNYTSVILEKSQKMNLTSGHCVKAKITGRTETALIAHYAA